MVVYNKTEELVLNLLGFVLLFLAARTSPVHASEVLSGAGVGLTAVVGSMSASLLVAGLLTVSGLNMHWYTMPWLGCTMYATSSLLGAVAARHWLHETVLHKSSPERNTEQAAHLGAQCVWATLLLFLMRGSNHGILPLLWVLPPALARLVANKMSLSLTILTTTMGLVLPLILSFQYVLELADFFFPLMGRIGTEVPTELVCAVLFGFIFAWMLLVPLSVVHLLPRDVRAVALRILALLVVALGLLVAARFPYDAVTHTLLLRIYL
jgi:hypothetical protein